MSQALCVKINLPTACMARIGAVLLKLTGIVIVACTFNLNFLMKCQLLLFFVLSFNQGVIVQCNDSTFYLMRYATTGIPNRTNEAS